MPQNKVLILDKRDNICHIVESQEAESILNFFDNPGKFPHPDDCFWSSFGQILRRDIKHLKFFIASPAAEVLYSSK